MMINLEKVENCDIKEVIGVQEVTGNIYFISGRRSRFWHPRTCFGIIKNNKFHTVNVNKDLILTLKNVDKDKIEEAIENGDAVKYSSAELIEIGKEIGYLVPPSKETLKKTVSWFVHGVGEDYEEGMAFGNKIKRILTNEEIQHFHDWEEWTGYEDSYDEFSSFIMGEDIYKRTYDCEDSELESALYVVMNSPRLLNSAIFLKEWGISDHSLRFVWNYLLSYKHRDSFVEVMHFSDWNNKDPDELFEKYNIRKDPVDKEDKSFIRRNDATTYEGDEYKMSIQITASFDDWDGLAVVMPKDCKLSPLEIVSAGESVDYVEDNFWVKNHMVRCI